MLLTQYFNKKQNKLIATIAMHILCAYLHPPFLALIHFFFLLVNCDHYKTILF